MNKKSPWWLRLLAVLLVLIVVVSSFALSFTVLRDLAVTAGIPASVGWLWPVVVDGTITAATLMLYTGRGGRMPLITLLLFGLASVVGNVAHILMAQPDGMSWLIPTFVGLIPPVGLLMTVELLGGLLRTDDQAEPTHEPAQEPWPTPGPDRPGPGDQTVVHDRELVHAPVHVVEPVAQTVAEPAARAASEAPVARAEPPVPETLDQPGQVVEPVDEQPSETVAQILTAADEHSGVSPEPRSEAAVEQPPAPIHDQGDEPLSEEDDAPRVTKSKPAIHPEQPVPTFPEEQVIVVSKARKLIDEGKSIRATAEELGLSRSTLSRWLKAADDTEADESLAPITRLHAVNQ